MAIDAFHMTSLVMLVVVLFMIAFEHRINVHKAAAAGLLLAVVMVTDWIKRSQEGVGETDFDHLTAEIGDTLFLLIAAMGLVGTILVLKGFDLVIAVFSRYGLRERGVLNAIGVASFCLSPVIDNVTASVAMLGIARELFDPGGVKSSSPEDTEVFGEENGKVRQPSGILILIGFIVVTMANAGGAFSFIGDVTTIMLWNAGVFEPMQVVTWAFVPSFLFGAIMLLTANLKLKSNRSVNYPDVNLSYSGGQIVLLALTLSCFFLSVVAESMGYPAYFGLVAGLGVVWVLIGFMHIRTNALTDLDLDLEHSLLEVHVPTILFFLSILIPIGIMSEMGALTEVVAGLVNVNPSMILVLAELGILSAAVDNVPLTAIAISELDLASYREWALLAFTVGVGGSLLPFGSVPGVYAMGVIHGFTTGKFVKEFTLWILVGFIAAVFSGWLTILIFA